MKDNFNDMEKLPAVQLFILSRDRLDYCRQTVESAVRQTYKNIEIIVSDNSEKDDVEEMLTSEFPEVTVIRRKPTLPALEHFNTLIAEATAPLLVLFHDDDTLHSDYVSSMVEIAIRNSDVAAVGCNAYVTKGVNTTQQHFMGLFQGNLKINNPIDFLEPYLSLSLVCPAPFPGYMYRTHAIKNFALEKKKGGKHSDVSFLLSIISTASILWIDKCLFDYRYHGGGDSSKESIPERLSWLRYICVTYNISPKSSLIMEYKYMYWFNWLSQRISLLSARTILNLINSRRSRIAIFFIFSFGMRLAFTKAYFWNRLLRKVIR